MGVFPSLFFAYISGCFVNSISTMSILLFLQARWSGVSPRLFFTLTSQSFMLKIISTILVLSFLHAMWRGVSCCSFRTFGLHFVLATSFDNSELLLMQIVCNGVLRLSSRFRCILWATKETTFCWSQKRIKISKIVSTPQWLLFKMIVINSLLLCLHAMCKGVLPASSSTLGSTPVSTIILTASEFPLAQAMWSAVSPQVFFCDRSQVQSQTRYCTMLFHSLCVLRRTINGESPLIVGES